MHGKGLAAQAAGSARHPSPVFLPAVLQLLPAPRQAAPAVPPMFEEPIRVAA